ncbi:MAG: acyl-CoA--6-aminopenicillanic acid acyltransferase [Anaerolineae bacterium]|nr:acyl-CoA--6-aminopenicillanic acid acyltransferase [Anaerolineae bacterium]
MNHVKQATFNHVVLEGTSYEVGQQQAHAIKEIPGFVQFLRSGEGKFSPEVFAQITSLYDRYSPGINEEIQGFAEVLEIPASHMAYFTFSYLQSGHCSHLVALPQATDNNHVLAGRSYEFSETVDDLRLCTTRVKGRYAHIGCSTLFFGRTEGMNEQGLLVTLSAGGFPVGAGEGMRPPLQDGVQFWAVIRAVLDQCQTVDEAIDLIREIPACGNPIMLVADKSGQAALIEVFGADKGVRRIDATSPEGYIYATNHFVIPEMRALNNQMGRHSDTRHKLIGDKLSAAAPHIDRDTIKQLLSVHYPAGLCAHYYEQFFGNLYSMVFDLTAGQLEICFGSPVVNEWHTFDLESEHQPQAYTIQFPQEHADPKFWEWLT